VDVNHREQSIGRCWSPERRTRGEDGFTFIELLVGMVVLGILAAIAIPMYLNHRSAAADKLAHSDLRSAVTVLEACAVEGVYPSRVNSVGAMTGCPDGRISVSDDTRLRYTTTGTPISSFMLASVNTSAGDHQVYCYNSADGGGTVVEVNGSLATATC